MQHTGGVRVGLVSGVGGRCAVAARPRFVGVLLADRRCVPRSRRLCAALFAHSMCPQHVLWSGSAGSARVAGWSPCVRHFSCGRALAARGLLTS